MIQVTELLNRASGFGAQNIWIQHLYSMAIAKCMKAVSAWDFLQMGCLGGQVLGVDG